MEPGVTTRLTLLAAVLLVLSACSGQRTVESDGLSIFVQRSTFGFGGGNEAEVGGILAVQDGCVVLGQPDFPDLAYPVVWPAGTSIASSDPVAIELPSGELLAIGDTVAGGGGYPKEDGVDVTLPEGCLASSPHGEVAVFNAGDDPVKK